MLYNVIKLNFVKTSCGKVRGRMYEVHWLMNIKNRDQQTATFVVKMDWALPIFIFELEK